MPMDSFGGIEPMAERSGVHKKPRGICRAEQVVWRIDGELAKSYVVV
jgi:hypothetical protein